MLEENKTIELNDEELEKANGGIKLGSFVKHETMYWVCPHCGAEIMTSYTFIGRHLFLHHNEMYNFKDEREAITFAQTIDWWY